jgi:hypothetical protein
MRGVPGVTEVTEDQGLLQRMQYSQFPGASGLMRGVPGVADVTEDQGLALVTVTCSMWRCISHDNLRLVTNLVPEVGLDTIGCC